MLAWSNALYGLVYYLLVLVLQLPALFPLFKSRALALLASSVSPPPSCLPYCQ